MNKFWYAVKYCNGYVAFLSGLYVLLGLFFLIFSTPVGMVLFSTGIGTFIVLMITTYTIEDVEEVD